MSPVCLRLTVFYTSGPRSHHLPWQRRGPASPNHGVIVLAEAVILGRKGAGPSYSLCSLSVFTSRLNLGTAQVGYPALWQPHADEITLQIARSRRYAHTRVTHHTRFTSSLYVAAPAVKAVQGLPKLTKRYQVLASAGYPFSFTLPPLPFLYPLLIVNCRLVNLLRLQLVFSFVL
jgi:hypothetical protein